MELRLGASVFTRGRYIVWQSGDDRQVTDCADIIDFPPDAGALSHAPAKPIVLVGDHLAEAAAASDAGLVCTNPAHARDAGVRSDGLIIDAGTAPKAAYVTALTAEGHPVLVTPLADDEATLAATVSVYAWLDVMVFRVNAQYVHATRQALDMVASIKGHRPPALTRRGLA